jgi:hypothetical protein
MAISTIMDYVKPIAKAYNLDDPNGISALIEAFQQGIKLGMQREIKNGRQDEQADTH